MQTSNPWGQQHVASVEYNSAAPPPAPPSSSPANQPPEPPASEATGAEMRTAGQDASRVGAARGACRDAGD